LGEHEKFLIFEVAADGKPLAPIENVKKFTNQCGVIVGDTILITIREWNKPKEGGVSFVHDISKRALGCGLIKYHLAARSHRGQ
jgi:hypothetical protein